MVTVEDPRLAQIRALCDDAGYSGLPSNLVARIRAVLGAPSVDATPPQGIDRDALIADAIRMLYEHSPSVDHEYDREEAEELVDRMLLHGSYLTAAPDRDIIAAAIQTDFDVRNSAAFRVADRLLALVRPVPPQGIDRDALNRVLEEFSLLGLDEKSADRILALVRPVEGVVLTPEEVRIVRWLLMFWGVDDKRERAATPPSRESINALAARLEAAQ